MLAALTVPDSLAYVPRRPMKLVGEGEGHHAFLSTRRAYLIINRLCAVTAMLRGDELLIVRP